MHHNLHNNFVIKSSNGSDVIISGYASVYNIADQHNDIITKGAFSEANKKSIRLLWQHDQQKPIGIIHSIEEDDYGLKIEAAVNSKTTTGKETIELIKQGAVDAFSIGFHIISSNYNKLEQRVITKAELIEISVVTFPANPQAQINYVDNINNFKGVIMDQDLIIKKINKLEDEFGNLQSFMARPENGLTQDTEHKEAFNNYIRKGSISELITKGFSSSEGEGGALITSALYNKIISEMNLLSPMRQLASIETISTNALDVVIEDGKFTSGWIGDAEERPDTDTPKLQQKRILVHELYSQPKATQRLIDDSAIQIESWLSERLTYNFLREENQAFINGDGKKKPFGILGADHKIPMIDSKEKISPQLLLEVINSLEEGFLANATFLMNRVTLSVIQKFTDKDGRFIWQQSLSEGMKQTIFGIPVVCCSDMPTMDREAPAIVIGDFKSAYKIVDRSGINIMRDPYTNKPFVKFYAVKRVGGDVVNPRALRLMKFTAE